MNSDELDILLVEDNQDDIDLALHALRREKLANRIFVARDGERSAGFPLLSWTVCTTIV